MTIIKPKQYLIIVFFSLFFGACRPDVVTPDNTPPPTVSNFTAKAYSKKVKLSWNMLTQSDLSHFELNISPGNMHIPFINKDSIQKQVDSLSNYTEYTFKLVSVDENGNASAAVVVSATPYKRLDFKKASLPSAIFHFRDLWGNSTNGFFAVGLGYFSDSVPQNRGFVLQRKGNSWHLLNFPSTAEVTSVKGLNDTSIFFATAKGEIYLYNGTRFTLRAKTAKQTWLNSLGIINYNTLLAGGTSALFEFINQKFDTIQVSINDTITSIELGNNNEIFCSDASGYLYLFDGTGWNEVSASANRIGGVAFNPGTGKMLMANNDEKIKYYFNNSLAEVALYNQSPFEQVSDVAFSKKDSSFYAAGRFIYAGFQGQWARIFEEEPGVFTTIWASPDGFVVAAGDNNLLYQVQIK